MCINNNRWVPLCQVSTFYFKPLSDKKLLNYENLWRLYCVLKKFHRKSHRRFQSTECDPYQNALVMKIFIRKLITFRISWLLILKVTKFKIWGLFILLYMILFYICLIWASLVLNALKNFQLFCSFCLKMF